MENEHNRIFTTPLLVRCDSRIKLEMPSHSNISSSSSSSMADLQLLLTGFTVFLLSASSSSCQRVTMSVYYETLCPYCADFIVNHLANAFADGSISAIDLRLIPWGNAVIGPDGTVICQHGDTECELNKIHACAINTYPQVEKHFAFVYCTERLSLENKLKEWASCVEMAGLSPAIIDCYVNGYGNQIEQRYSQETSELNPPHQFVPWVVVNNQPLREDYQNFLLYVCNVYGGSEVPEACKLFNSSATSNNSMQTLSNTHLVCYAHNQDPGQRTLNP